MNFNNSSYLLYIALVICLFSIAVIKYEKTYFKWVRTYWNYARTKRSLIASFFYLIGMSLFLISLLDLRGPEENIKTSIPDQKTIIILDSSASMLAEDIKPNRFSKAIQLARHFVKNSPGHQIAIVLFSDVQKRLMPFTDDIDLLDSRLAALDQVNSVGGGSNIAQAIQEATGYFQTEENKAGAGNILVFTDAEESDGGFNLKLDSSYNLAVVGIGTAKGAQIPIRWKDGSLRGYKESGGQPVITKLEENYIKSLGKNVSNYHYWIANSYSLPTTEIASFFRNELEKNLNQGDMRIKPVYSYYILIPAILIYVLSVIISRFASLRMLSLVFALLLAFPMRELRANDKNGEIKINPLVVEKMNSLKNGNFSNEEALKAAQSFLELQDYAKAAILYEEYLTDDSKIEAKINAVSSFILAKQYSRGLEMAESILNDSGVSDKNKNILRSNLVFIFGQKGNEKNKGKDQSKENNDSKDENQDNKDDQKQDKKENQQNKDQQSKDKQDKGDQKDDKKENKDNKDKSDPNQRDPKDSKENKDKDLTDPKKEKDDGKKQDKNPENKPQEKQAPQTLEEKEEQIKEQRKLIKTPAMIKQILNDDRELQKQMMDTSTDSKGSTKKDW